jgi:hypothetical protein
LLAFQSLPTFLSFVVSLFLVRTGASCHVVSNWPSIVGFMYSCLCKGVLHDHLRCPRFRADPAIVLVVCVPDELASFEFVEGQESVVSPINGNVFQLRQPDYGVESIAGIPILVPVARDIPVVGRVLKYFQICFHPSLWWPL